MRFSAGSRAVAWALAVVLAATSVEAAGPSSSLRPIARIGTDARNPPAEATRPQAFAPTTVSASAVLVPGLKSSLRPEARSGAVLEQAMAKRRLRKKGAVCGDLDIQGEVVGPVPGKLSGCGVKDAVRVRSVAGVSLSQASVMDCGTANALKSWVVKGAKPAIGSKGGGLARLKVAAHYACRTRNNKTGARISEHGKGRAIDISGVILNDGSTITVLKGWNTRGQSKALRRMHKAACGPFGTVLGPEADRYHKDHFHFDTARYRSGPYCR